jgi:N-acetylglucosaminyl-diphospho-decaprenol L-rhamnosyltransferase
MVPWCQWCLAPHGARVVDRRELVLVVVTSSIEIVIVNWNTGHLLRDCLASIAQSGDGQLIRQVTVVDNGSSDGSADGLDDVPLPLKVIRNSRSIGYGGACNQGAADSAGDYLLFLNSDTRLFPDTLSAVTDFMDSERSEGIGICGAQMVDEEGRPTISCSRFPTLRVLFGKMTGLDRLLPHFFPSHHLSAAETRESRLVDEVIGAFYFVRRRVFAELGGFDERYFLYFDEVDFSLRALRQGFRTYFLKEATVFHAGTVSTSQTRDVQLYHQLRSRILFAYRYWSRWQASLLVVVTFTVELPARFTRAALDGSPSDISAIARAYGWIIRDLVHLRRSPDRS